MGKGNIIAKPMWKGNIITIPLQVVRSVLKKWNRPKQKGVKMGKGIIIAIPLQVVCTVMTPYNQVQKFCILHEKLSLRCQKKP